MELDPEAAAAPAITLRRLAAGILLLSVLTALLQGASVGYGLVLDDYNHRAELRAGDWSFPSLVYASHLGAPRRRVRMWWQEAADLYFFRPLAFLLMRATYVLGGWRPEIMHVASLAWGVACATLVLLLAWRTLAHFGWALLAATLFLAHPNNFLAPRWIACQNEQMATAFTLAALLVYGTSRGWWGEPRIRRIGIIAALAAYAAALGCRESAILLPFLLIVGDAATAARSPGEGTPDRSRAAAFARGVPAYLAFAAVAVAYLLIRRHMLGPVTIPARPYAWPPGEAGFLPFVADKFVYYILGLWACIPIVGFAGQEQMHAFPLLFYGLFAAIVLGWGIVLTWLRRRRRAPRASPALDCSPAQVLYVLAAHLNTEVPRRPPERLVWLWLAVALLPLGPVLPVFASAHHLYLASAGACLATVMVVSLIHERAAARPTFVRRVLRRIIQAGLVVVLAGFTGMSFVLDRGVAGLAAACQLPGRQAVLLGRPMKPDDRLFFINLPMLAFNCVPAIEEARGVAPLHGYVLTFAPAFLAMDRSSRLEQTAPNQLRLTLDPPGWFSGLIGQSILQGIRRTAPFAAGETFATPEFKAEILRSDARGVQQLLFTFQRNLRDPAYHFFFGSPTFDAYPLTFE
jgi:hypothetical protein